MRNDFQKHLKDHETALAFAKDLRNEAAASRNRFYEFLVEIEKRPELWNLIAGTFAKYLRSTHLTSSSRFESWKRGRNILQPEVSERLGFHATRLIADVEDESDRRAAIASMAKTYENEGGVALSAYAARNAVGPYLHTKPTPIRPTRAQLEAEVSRLTKENERLRARIRELLGDASDAAE